MLVHYMPLVRTLANKVAFGLPQHVDQNDLISYGTFGLIDAIDKFDPLRGFKFETYAISRIRGSILDELRSADWIPRSVRSKAKQIDAATQKLGAELARTPSASELAEELDITVDQYNEAIGQIFRTGMVGLDDVVKTQGVENITVGDSIADSREHSNDTIDIDQLRTLFADTIRAMSSREKIVMTLYYFEGLTLGDIGVVLGVTESRICQIHTKAIANLLPLIGLDA